MANNNVNNNQAFNANDEILLGVLNILAQMGSPVTLQQQLDAERARNQALALRTDTAELTLEMSNRLWHQKITNLRAQIDLEREYQADLAFEADVTEEENQNLRERLNAATDDNDELREEINRQNREIVRLYRENERIQNSIFSPSFISGYVLGMTGCQGLQQTYEEQILELQRQLAARDQEPPKEEVKVEKSEKKVKEEGNEERDIKMEDTEWEEARET